jgi:RNA polymerase sigma factor (sigma-70 family)
MLEPVDRPAASPTQPAPVDGFADILDSYLRDIRDTRVLSGEEQNDLCESMEAAEQTLRSALAEIPATAREVVSLWHERKQKGLVTAALSRFHRDGSDRNWGLEIDRQLAHIEESLARLDEELAGRASRATLAATRSEIARHLGKAEIALPQLISILATLSSRDTSPAMLRAAVREAGGRRAFDHHLAQAGEALAQLSDSKNRFVTHNLRLVIRCAKNYRNQGVPFLDLIQEGNTGLIRAVEKFDHRRGYKFSTYAVWWIEQALVRAVAGDSRVVRVPSPIIDQQRKLKRIEQALRTNEIAEPSDFELASRLSMDPTEVDQLRRSFGSETSCQAQVAGTDALTVEETLTNGEDVEERGLEFDRHALRVRFRDVMPTLADRERRVIEWRFGLGGRRLHTLAEIGEKLQVSRERVRQIEREALARLRENQTAQALAAELNLD